MRRLRLAAAALAAAAGTAGTAVALTPAATPAVRERVDILAGRREGQPAAVVIGAGAAGVASAVRLAERGYAVAIVDAAGGVAEECSAAALGGMQRSSIVVNAGTWRSTLGNLFGAASAAHRYVYVDWGAVLTDPHFWSWSRDFTTCSLLGSQAAAEARHRDCLGLATWAVDMLQESGCVASPGVGALGVRWTQKGGGGGGGGRGGPGMGGLEPARELTREEALATEPCLRLAEVERGRPIAGAEYQPSAARGNCGPSTHALYASLPQAARDASVFGARVVAFERGGGQGEGGDVTALVTADGRALVVPEGAAVVVAAGAWTGPLLRRCAALYAPVYPLRGYTLDVDASGAAADALPHTMLVDTEVNIFAARYGDRLRISSIGEFGSYSRESRLAPRVTAGLREAAALVLPGVREAIEAAPVVSGLRPYCADGAPLVGPLGANLYVNTGPGSNGWKLAVGTGELVARHVAGERLDDLPFDAAAFDPKSRVRRAWWRK